MKAHGEEDDVKADLQLCMKKMMEQKKTAAEEAKRMELENANRPKIQEVEKPAFKKI